MAIPLAGLAIFFIWQWLNGGITPRQAKEVIEEATTSRRRDAPAPAAATPDAKREEPSKPTKSAKASAIAGTSPSDRKHRGDIVLIIDDLGYDAPLERLMELDPNLNCSVLPNGPLAAQTANRLNERGFEVLCHLPMEPRGGQAPGSNAILTSMTDEEIAQLTRENIASVPHARGVNNHMGSRATQDRRVMASVLGAMPVGLYFVDSRTTGGSVAAAVARELNVRTASRDVFLDDDEHASAVRRQVDALARAAEKHGIAIGIGHPYPATLRVLEERIPELRERGFRFVRASEVVR